MSSVHILFPKFETYLHRLVCQCLPQGSCMNWKLYSPWANPSYLHSWAGLHGKTWKYLDNYNNVNLKPINILLWFRFGKIFSPLNRHEKQHLLSAVETFFHARNHNLLCCLGIDVRWKVQSWHMLSSECLRQYCAVIVADVIIFSVNRICLGLNGLILID